ncbi:ATP-dependent helicase [Marinisporobacter balticus]|uniref:DNA 3'-5' helicase n=1 Tax=Marinisporobacter balticus TaxID=2018667 RepID=A0A4R2KEP6_9FIRM|nr:ATP-dependent helicase [Marinisporobacter balticus]TCO71494.1 DNA helicase-2/ATP-dependent DNA helicase PcrA [Marinisporobacter balticus]
MHDSFFHILKNQQNIQLNSQQKQAVLHKDGPVLLLAVPGSGKTTTLICRTAHLILHHKIHPSNILSVTFSRFAAKDMKKRFYDVFGKIIHQNVYFSTIHRLALRIVGRYAKMNGFAYTIIEGEHATIHKNTLLRDIYQEVNHDFLNEDNLEELLSRISFVKNMMIATEDFHQYDFEINNFREIYTHYENYKKQHLLIDFDDMLSLALNILKNNAPLLNQYRNQYPYIQVDEAQDTSKVQHALIELLAYPRNNLFMVADDDQSIYGFRGAYPEALLHFPKTYKQSKTFFLEQNYRSSQEIVTLSNTFIQSNTKRYVKNMYTDNKEHTPIHILKAQNKEDQTNYLIEELSTCSKTTSAVLYRNNLSAIPLIDRLQRNQIPFSIQAFNLSFFNHWLTRDLLAFLDVSLNPYDIDSFERIYYKMNGYISKIAVSYIKEHGKSISVFKSLIFFPGLKDFQRKNLKRLEKDFHALSLMKPIDALCFIEENLAYKKYLKSNCQRHKYSYDNVLFLFTQLKMIASKTDSIIDFMERLSTLKKIILHAKNTKEMTPIILSTVHSSKGLEFDRVYLMDLVDGQFPPKSKLDASTEEKSIYLEEERRLFYVGMTRARKSLSLLIPSFQDGSYMRPSPFVEEVNTCMKSSPHIKRTFAPSKSVHESIPHEFSIDSFVEHKKFGKGIIKSIDGDIAQIDFNGLGIRGLSLPVCIAQKILTHH